MGGRCRTCPAAPGEGLRYRQVGQTREYIHGPNASDGEEDEFEEEQVEDSAGEEGAADSEAGSEAEEAVDETIEIDQAPARTTACPADTTDESLKLAAEIGAKAAAEISTSPTSPGADAA